MRRSTEGFVWSGVQMLFTVLVAAIPPHGWIDLVCLPVMFLAGVTFYQALVLRGMGE